MLGVDVLAEDVSTERANRPFLRFQFQFDAERFGAAGRRKPAGLRVSRADAIRSVRAGCRFGRGINQLAV